MDFKLHRYLILVTVYVVVKISSDQSLCSLEFLLSAFDGSLPREMYGFF